MTRTLVIGIGNALQGPDAFGPAVIHRLRNRSDLPPAMELVDAHTDLLSCLDRFTGVDHVVLVDAVLGAGTGAVVAVDEPTFSTWSAESPSSHEISASMVVRLFRTLYPGATVRFTLVGHDVARIGDETVASQVIAVAADAVLRVCGR